jgi:MFS transporter, PPP family, 3-phenylpropionic acid transporter
VAASNPIRNLKWTYVLVGLADGSLLTFVPLLLFERGLTAAQIGVVLAAVSACSLVAGLLWGYLVDRGLPAERMMVVANACAVALALGLTVAGSGFALAAVIVALYVARSPMTLLDPVALRRLRTTPRTDWARIRLRMSAGWAVSVILSGALFQVVSLRLIPFVYAPLAALVGVWIWRFVKPLEAAPPASQPNVPSAVVRAKFPLAMLGFMFSLFLVGAALAATQNFLTVQINVLGGGAFLIGAAAAFQALTEIPTMGYTHVLMRRVSHKALFAAGCVIYVLIFIAWAFTGNAVVAALMKLVAGVAFALTLVSAVLITEELSPPHLRATGQALTKSVLFGLAPIFGALAGGFLYSAAGPRVMFLTSTALMVLAGAVVLFAVPTRERKAVPSQEAEPAPSLQPAAAEEH